MLPVMSVIFTISKKMVLMNRCTNPLLLVSLLLALVSARDLGAATVDEIPARPNFIVIFCDDLGWGDLSWYGHPTIATPHLDRMAAEGMRLTQF